MEIFIGILSLALAFLSYGIYFRDILRRKTKPHAITWLVWAVLNAFIFLQQLSHDAGPGAWVTGVTAIANTLIFILALKYGERSITRLDWVCLAIAMVIIGLWIHETSVEFTVVLACVVFVIGFIPTLRKSYRKPTEETILTFGLNSIKFFLALFALHSLTIVTALYPITLGIVNGFFVVFLITRLGITNTQRSKLKRRT